MRFIGLCCLGFLVAALIGCDRGEASTNIELGKPLSGRLLLSGSSTIAPLASEIGKRFEAAHPGVRIDVQTGGSSKGVADAATGRVDVGMASRALKPQDPENLVAHTIALDGVCMMVHADNPVASLTNEQVRGIYAGAIDDWSQVGGEPGPIVVINRAEGRSEVEMFTTYFDLATPEVEADSIAGDNEQGITVLANNPGAITYMSIGTGESAVARGEPVKLLPMDGVPATTAAVREGRFPIARPLNLLTSGEPDGLAAVFIGYATSPEVTDLVLNLNYVPTHE